MEEPYLLGLGGADIWRLFVALFEIFCLDWKRPSLKKALLVPCWIFEAADEVGDGAEVVVTGGGGIEDEAAVVVLSIVVWVMSFYNKNKNEHISIHITVITSRRHTTHNSPERRQELLFLFVKFIQ